MATDRQASCIYCICDYLCFKAGRESLIADCNNCDKYKPMAGVGYKNQKRVKLEKIRKGERY